MEQLFSPVALFVMQVLWGIIMLLVALIMNALSKKIESLSKEIKALNDKVLACYVPRSECTLASRDKWAQIETMEGQIQVMQMDISAIKERLKVRREERT